MAASRSYDAGTAHRDLETEIERLRAQTLLSWEKEARNLSWFGLEDGMAVLELGSGPGFTSEQLLNMVPQGTVTAVEIDSTLTEKAKQYLKGTEPERLRIIEASAADTGLEDNSFDFAVARFLFQHLDDPVGVAKETLRVLKPGGKLVVTDLDDDLFGLLEPPIPELPTVFKKWGRMQAERGGDRTVGRRLWRILEVAGFQQLDLEAVVFHSDALGLEPFLAQLNADRLRPLVDAGLLSEQDFADARDSFDRFGSAPKPFVLLILLMACGEKC